MKYLKIAIAILILMTVFFLGVICKKIPYLTFNREVKLFEPLSFLTTLMIGLFIPFFIKRWIDDSRQVKNNINDEIKDTLREISSIKEKIKFCYSRGSITQTDKEEIVSMFEGTDLKINCLNTQLEQTFDKETKSIRKDIYDEYINFWKFTTGTELMSSNFVIVNEDFYRRYNQSFSKVETKMKQAINTIHRI